MEWGKRLVLTVLARWAGPFRIKHRKEPASMGPTLYRKKGPLIAFLLPAFVFLILFLYYPFLQNILNSFSDITGLGSPAQGLNDP